jgi:hypothetical protein
MSTLTLDDLTLNDVEKWRASQLVRAGFTVREAGSLACRPDVDLHYAIFLLERGCPTDTALRILL